MVLQKRTVLEILWVVPMEPNRRIFEEARGEEVDSLIFDSVVCIGFSRVQRWLFSNYLFWSGMLLSIRLLSHCISLISVFQRFF